MEKRRIFLQKYHLSLANFNPFRIAKISAASESSDETTCQQLAVTNCFSK